MREEIRLAQNEKQWDSRPAIALETRRTLQRLRGQGWLDQASVAVIERVLDCSRPGSLSLFVYQLALQLGAGVESALRSASSAELLYAAIDFTDDVEDGDESDSLPGTSHPVCINTAAQLLVLAWRAITELDQALSASVASLVSGMFSGQRLELTREGWSAEAYERVGRANGGMQLETYVRLAAFAAGVPAEPLIKPLGAIGILMQIASDEPKRDDRLYSLPEHDRHELASRARTEMGKGLAGLPDNIVELMRGLLPG